MRLEAIQRGQPKGWFCGPWNSDLPISIGYANEGVEAPHLHTQIQEIYLVASGTAEIRVESQTLRLAPGDLLILDPGEAHTFLSSSPDYMHFMLHVPGLAGDAARSEKISVPRERLV